MPQPGGLQPPPPPPPPGSLRLLSPRGAPQNRGVPRGNIWAAAGRARPGPSGHPSLRPAVTAAAPPPPPQMQLHKLRDPPTRPERARGWRGAPAVASLGVPARRSGAPSLHPRPPHPPSQSLDKNTGFVPVGPCGKRARSCAPIPACPRRAVGAFLPRVSVGALPSCQSKPAPRHGFIPTLRTREFARDYFSGGRQHRCVPFGTRRLPAPRVHLPRTRPSARLTHPPVFFPETRDRAGNSRTCVKRRGREWAVRPGRKNRLRWDLAAAHVPGKQRGPEWAPRPPGSAVSAPKLFPWRGAGGARPRCGRGGWAALPEPVRSLLRLLQFLFPFPLPAFFSFSFSLRPQLFLPPPFFLFCFRLLFVF